jgi:hypothetical protein
VSEDSDDRETTRVNAARSRLDCTYLLTGNVGAVDSLKVTTVRVYRRRTSRGVRNRLSLRDAKQRVLKPLYFLLCVFMSCVPRFVVSVSLDNLESFGIHLARKYRRR